MAHQTGIHGEGGWRADRGPKGSAAPGLRAWSLHPPLPRTLQGSFLFSFAAASHILGEYRLLYVAGSGCTWVHTARVEVSCVLIWGRMCLYVPIWVFLFFSEGGVYPDVHIWKSAHACAHVLCIQSCVCTSGCDLVMSTQAPSCACTSSWFWTP